MWREFEGIYIQRPTEITIGSGPVPRFPAPMRKGLENSKNSSGPFSPGWADVRNLRKLFVSCNLNRFNLGLNISIQV